MLNGTNSHARDYDGLHFFILFVPQLIFLVAFTLGERVDLIMPQILRAFMGMKLAGRISLSVGR